MTKGILTLKVRAYLRTWIVTLWKVVVSPIRFRSPVHRRRFYWASEYLRSSLPLVSISALLNGSLQDADTLRLKAIPERPHNCTVFELYALGLLTLAVRPTRCVEIGTYDGRSALAVAANLADGAEVVTMNLPPDYADHHPDLTRLFDVQLSRKVVSGERWGDQIERHKITQVFGDSKNYDFSLWAPSQLIFIDGAHDQRTVSSDTQKALSIVDRNNGIIIWHDATHYGVALP